MIDYPMDVYESMILLSIIQGDLLIGFLYQQAFKVLIHNLNINQAAFNGEEMVY